MKRLFSRIDKAIWEYRMLEENDRVLICVSGGADSMALVKILAERAFIFAREIKLYALYVDMGYGNSADQRCSVMQEYLTGLGLEHRILRTHIGPYAHSEENLENPCFLCTRIRRKKIFETAEELNCNKIVFAHHKDDIVETLMLNMIFSRNISTMPPRLEVMKGKYYIIRPLLFVSETMIKEYRKRNNIPFFDQECPTDGHSQRQYVKALLHQIDHDHPGARENIFQSMYHVKPDYLP